MPEEKINFEKITQIYREERRKKGLAPLPKNFFEELGGYVEELRKRCEDEDKKNYHSPKAIMLRDELKKALKKREEIWLLRMRKVVTSASSKLMGASIETKGYTKEEQNIYKNIVNILEESTNEIYEFGKRGEEREEEKKEEEKREATPLKKKETKETKEPKEKPRDEVIVHILEDLPPLAGADENYHLKKNDIITLPKHLAKVLCDKKKAKRIDAKAQF